MALGLSLRFGRGALCDSIEAGVEIEQSHLRSGGRRHLQLLVESRYESDERAPNTVDIAWHAESPWTGGIDGRARSREFVFLGHDLEGLSNLTAVDSRPSVVSCILRLFGVNKDILAKLVVRCATSIAAPRREGMYAILSDTQTKPRIST